MAEASAAVHREVGENESSVSGCILIPTRLAAENKLTETVKVDDFGRCKEMSLFWLFLIKSSKYLSFQEIKEINVILMFTGLCMCNVKCKE